MTDRRPHWDDDLVEAVRSKIGMHQHGPIGEIRIYNPFDDEVYNVIAAVEDWALSAPIFDLYLSRKHAPDKAAIQRVRELHHSKLDRHPQGDVQRCIACLDLWPCPTIRAIEGGSDE